MKLLRAMKEQEKMHRKTITSFPKVVLFHNYTLIRPRNMSRLYAFQPKSQLLALPVLFENFVNVEPLQKKRWNMETYGYNKQHFFLYVLKRLRAKRHKDGFSINVFYFGFPEPWSFMDRGSCLYIERYMSRLKWIIRHYLWIIHKINLRIKV